MLLFGWLNSFRYNYTLHTQQTRPFSPPIFESDLHRRYIGGTSEVLRGGFALFLADNFSH
jgi:hypothetical protein